MPVVVEICELVVPLGQYAQRVFEESNDNQKSTDGGQVPVGSISARASQNWRARSVGSAAKAGSTHGLTGSDSVSRKSSILLVCSRSWSSGLGSFVVLSLRPPLPKGLWLPRW